MGRFRPVLALLLALVALAGQAAVTTTVFDVQRTLGTIRVLLLAPDVPVATLIVLTGGEGILGLTATGGATSSRYTNSVSSRNTQRFLDQGYAVAHVDVRDGLIAGLNNFYRATTEHYDDLAAVVQQVRSRVNAPTWIVGYSAGTISAANLAVHLSASPPFGLILLAPVTVDAGAVNNMDLGAIRSPTFVLNHALDGCAFTPPAGATAILAGLTGAPLKEHVQLNGGTQGIPGACDGLAHGFSGLDTEVVGQVATWVAKGAPALGVNNYQGLWYRGEVESGWGVNVAHQGNTLFVTWFTYDTDGSQMWLVGPDVRRTTGNTYTGQLFRTTGPAFNSVPFSPSQIGITPVGTATFAFNDANNGTFAYSVNATSQTKAITRQVFGSLPTCAAGAGGTTLHFQDLWYAAPAESESGWGVNLTQQGDILFATWFTYDATGRAMWIVGPRLERTAGNTFAGPLFRTTGPAFSASPWNPASVTATQVGTATLTFTAAHAGTFAYTVNAISQSKAIVRQVYAAPVTVCR